ncbi:MAG TPA: LPS export ABC transporter ATP-binding protein [Planctomycetes bacterium]|nr:LPS export ABC transporter ATP-binding protein [Planctomycetota bacterium]
MSFLVAEGLHKRYGGRIVVHDVSIEVDTGEIVGLLGPNGAGKTTTFSMVMGLIRADRGRIHLGGKDITRETVARRARLGMGYLAQEPSVFKGLTVRDNILAVLEWLPGLSRGERRDRADRILAEMHLDRLATRRAALLSGGERRRLEIARILVTEPKLLLLDEPFSGVDPIAVEEIQKLVVGLRERGMGILMTDHNVRETLNVTDRAYIIHEGRILQHGPARRLIEDERVRRAYLGRRFVMPELAEQDPD